MKTMPLEIIECEAVGRWSQEQLTLGDDGNRLFIRINPSYHEDDKGIYFVRLYLEFDRQTFGHSRYNFHLIGSTFGVSRSEDFLLSFWPGSVMSGRVDNERTPKIAALTLPWLEQ
jgi:hypothetical protein